MAKLPMIDDSAGGYGVAKNPDGMSMDAWLRAQSSDVKEAIKNAIKNMTGALSPIGTSPDGNMSLQVPPMISGIADSYSRLAGTPSQPGNAYNLSGVPELDAPIQGDMSNVLLSLYGGNALNPLAKRPAGSVGAGVMRERGGVSVSGDHPNYQIMNDGSPVGRAYVREYPETIQLGQLHVNPEFQRQGIATEAQRLLAQQYGKPTVPDVSLSKAELARWQKNDPAAVADYEPFFGADSINSPRQGTDAYWAAQGSGVVPGSRAAAGELFSDTGKPSIMGAAAATAGEQPRGITAYHGSPHDFDKFSLDKIGTGEGAQAYGHGLYFADSEGVARSYRDALAHKATDWTKLREQSGLPLTDEQAALAYRLSGSPDGKGPDGLAKVMQMRFSELRNEEAAAGLARMFQSSTSDAAGKMYQVRINAEPDQFLDWDKPLSQQSEKARNALAGRFASDPVRSQDLQYEGGASTPSYILRNAADEETTKALREAGIPGIRYLDGQSRADGAGSSNYVVFDDSLIEILKKYGMAGGALGAGALAQPDAANAQSPDKLERLKQIIRSRMEGSK